jgi:hypothetical protein
MPQKGFVKKKEREMLQKKVRDGVGEKKVMFCLEVVSWTWAKQRMCDI